MLKHFSAADDQILLSDHASSLSVQAYLRMCGLPIQVVCRYNAEYMSPSGKIPFIHVGNQVVSELGPVVQFTKAKLFVQWCDDATAGEISRPRYSSPYSWPLGNILAYQKQWEVRRKMNAIGWGGKTLEQNEGSKKYILFLNSLELLFLVQLLLIFCEEKGELNLLSFPCPKRKKEKQNPKQKVGPGENRTKRYSRGPTL
uniref:Metaxin 2 n=1 Tax=Poecilia latipinna TaxID=48699 RepID=A0A3B3TVF6_9TELE